MDIELVKYFINQNWIILACFGFALIMTVITFSRSNIPAVLPEHAVPYMNQGAVVIDIREAADFAKEHIREAVNLPLSKINQTQESVRRPFGEDDTVLVCCRSGVQFGSAIKQLKKTAPKTRFIGMQGGIIEWKKSNYPTETATRPNRQKNKKLKSQPSA